MELFKILTLIQIFIHTSKAYNVSPCVCYPRESLIKCIGVNFIPHMPEEIRTLYISNTNLGSLTLNKVQHFRTIILYDNLQEDCNLSKSIIDKGIELRGSMCRSKYTSTKFNHFFTFIEFNFMVYFHYYYY